MPFSILPLSVINVSICKRHYSVAMPFSILPLSLVLFSVRPLIRALAALFAIYPLSVVNVSICILLYSVSMHFSILPLSLVLKFYSLACALPMHAIVFPFSVICSPRGIFHRAKATPFSLNEYADIYPPIRICHFATAVCNAVFRLAIVMIFASHHLAAIGKWIEYFLVGARSSVWVALVAHVGRTRVLLGRKSQGCFIRVGKSTIYMSISGI